MQMNQFKLVSSQKKCLNTNILASSRSFSITESAERHEPAALKSLRRHSRGRSGQQHFS